MKKFVEKAMDLIMALFAIASPLSILLVSLYPQPTYAGLLPRWMQPCRGAFGSHPEVYIYEVLDGEAVDQFIAHKLWTKANDLVLLATILKEQLAVERIESNHLRNFIDNSVTLEGFPYVGTQNSRKQLVRILQEDFRRVSMAVVFVEQMVLDEESSPYYPNYAGSFSELESNIYALLCQLKLAIVDNEASVPFVRHESMHRGLRQSETIAQRHARDYVILTKLVSLFHSIQSDYRGICGESCER